MFSVLINNQTEKRTLSLMIYYKPVAVVHKHYNPQIKVLNTFTNRIIYLCSGSHSTCTLLYMKRKKKSFPLRNDSLILFFIFLNEKTPDIDTKLYYFFSLGVFQLNYITTLIEISIFGMFGLIDL